MRAGPVLLRAPGRRADARRARRRWPSSTWPTPAPRPRRWSARSPSWSRSRSTASPASSASPRAASRAAARPASSSRLNADMGRAMQDVRDRIAVVQSAFPKDAKAPTVARFDNDNSQPVVVMRADLADAQRARAVASWPTRSWRKRLQRVEGVAHGRRRRAWPSARCASTSTRRACAPTRSRRPQVAAGAARGQRRPAGGPAVGHARRTPSCASRAACATRASSPTWWSPTAAACR